MIPNETYPLLLHSIDDRGVPNLERINLLALGPVDAGRFALLLGMAVSDNDATPYKDRFIWLGNAELQEGDWVVLYTAPGERRVSTLPNGKRLYSAYWGIEQTLFHDPSVTALLIRIDGIAVVPATPRPFALPQGQTANALLPK